MATVVTTNSIHAHSPAAGSSQRGDVAASEASSVPDPHLVAEMKHEIDMLVQEITQLAGQDVSPESFYSGFLTRVVSAMAAVGGAVWIVADGGKLKLQYQVNLAQTGVDASPQGRLQHALLVKNVVESAQAVIAQPSSGPAKAGGASNPTELLVVLAPLVVDQQAQGVVEVF
jgi:hypothetical protein